MAGKDAGECSACRRPTVTAATGFSASNGSCHGNSGTIHAGRSPPLAPRPRRPSPATFAQSAGSARHAGQAGLPGHHVVAQERPRSGHVLTFPGLELPPFVASPHLRIQSPGPFPFHARPHRLETLPFWVTRCRPGPAQAHAFAGRTAQCRPRGGVVDFCNKQARSQLYFYFFLFILSWSCSKLSDRFRHIPAKGRKLQTHRWL